LVIAGNFLTSLAFANWLESVANHIVAGLYRKPFICLMGRSNARTYMHDSTIVISEPGSCATFACEMPFYTVERICDRAACMDAIDPQKVITAVNKVISQLP
jgi:ADP-heptose:LPS heptosyltransferase